MSTLLAHEHGATPHEELRGTTVPRLFTAPLITRGQAGECGCGCSLDRSTSYGFEVDDFARYVLGMPLDHWQRWLVIHAGEILPDGKPRFRKLLIIVARQNGKTHLLKVLSLFWLYVERWPMVLGQSTTLSMAKLVWESAQVMAMSSDWLADEFGTVRRDNNDPHWRTAGGCEYRIAASTRKGGRSLSVDRLLIDELREHQTWEAYKASMPTMNARPFGQAWMISNQGDDQSVVLDSLRKRAIRQMATALLTMPAVQPLEPELRKAMAEVRAGRETSEEEAPDADDEIGLFEYSAPPGARPDDPRALCLSNPNAGHPHDHAPSLKSLVAEGRHALAEGGDEETGFRTEILCQRVHALDAAIDPGNFAAADQPGTLEGLRSNTALCVDISPDQRSVILAAAAVLPDGRTVRGELVASWVNTALMRQELPELVARIRPRVFGWLPNGPAAAQASALAAPKKPGAPGSWPPRGVKVEEIRTEVTAVCMGLADLIDGGEFVHSASQPGQELLENHALSAAKLWKPANTWVFTAPKGGHVNAAYAMAGAVHLARTLPPSIGKPRLVLATGRTLTAAEAVT